MHDGTIHPGNVDGLFKGPLSKNGMNAFSPDPAVAQSSAMGPQSIFKNPAPPVPSIDFSNPDLFKDARILGNSKSDQGLMERQLNHVLEDLLKEGTESGAEEKKLTNNIEELEPEGDSFKFEVPASQAGATARLAPLLKKITEGGGFSALSPEEKAEYTKLNKWILDIQNQGDANQLANDSIQSLMTSILPTLFTQKFEQNELDRAYDQDQRRYREDRLEKVAQGLSEQQGRKGAFSFMKSLLPDFDFSVFGEDNELDPAYIPQLIQMAMSRASIKANRESQERSIAANKQNQVMAQPKIQFAV
jgi:hypothetical protein